MYATPVVSTVYVRGWVKPRSGTLPRDSKVHYVHAKLSEEPDPPMGPSQHGDSPSDSSLREQVTEITLPDPPSSWTGDLDLEIGAPLAARVAGTVNSMGLFGLWQATIALGAVLGCVLTAVMIPRARRQSQDWIWAASAGAALGASALATLLVVSSWRFLRREPRMPFAFVVLLALLHLTLAGLTFWVLHEWLATHA